jgi:hypothetical protein
VAAPFVARGRALTYTAGEVFDAGVMILAAKARTTDRLHLRKIWWTIPIGLAAGHAFAFQHNVRITGD